MSRNPLEILLKTPEEILKMRRGGTIPRHLYNKKKVACFKLVTKNGIILRRRFKSSREAKEFAAYNVSNRPKIDWWDIYDVKKFVQ